MVGLSDQVGESRKWVAQPVLVLGDAQAVLHHPGHGLSVEREKTLRRSAQ